MTHYFEGQKIIISDTKFNKIAPIIHRQGFHIKYKTLSNKKGMVEIIICGGNGKSRKSKNDFLNAMKIGEKIIVSSRKEVDRLRYSMLIRGMKPVTKKISATKYSIKRVESVPIKKKLITPRFGVILDDSNQVTYCDTKTNKTLTIGLCDRNGVEAAIRAFLK